MMLTTSPSNFFRWLVRPTPPKRGLLLLFVLCFTAASVSATVSHPVTQQRITISATMSSANLKNDGPSKLSESKPFYEVLPKALRKRKTSLQRVCPEGDVVARRVLEDYGAMFIAKDSVLPPPVCVFKNEQEVLAFQDQAGYETEFISYDDVQLQPSAMKALLKARKEALAEGLDITPRDGAEAGRRTYIDSERLWETRFLPALDHWLAQERLTLAEVERLRSLDTYQQVAAVLELERSGIFFSKDLSKSVLYSIAAPGTSQHIAMLAFDINEFANPRVRQILAEHGWFQTVLSDLPHFTFLGLKEKDLPKRGLKRVIFDAQSFWIPNV